jgi:hypothetical protein
VSGPAGIFGPDSVAWRIDREAAIFFGAGSLADRAHASGERWKSVPEVGEIVQFILADNKRPICMPARGRDADIAQLP